jgi:simple sugar transport system ATP-binding protein
VQLDIRDLTVRGDRGEPAVRALSLAVRAGEIVGVAGVSGNGQRELMEALVGQRARESGQVRVAGQPLPPPGPRTSAWACAPCRKNRCAMPAWAR